MLNEEVMIELQRQVTDRWSWGDQDLARHGGSCRILKGSHSGVYFLATEVTIHGKLTPVVKIGASKNIRTRVWQDLKGMIPSSVWLIYQHVSIEPKVEEKEFHNRFKSYNLFREWFLLEPIAKEMGLPWEKMII